MGLLFVGWPCWWSKDKHKTIPATLPRTRVLTKRIPIVIPSLDGTRSGARTGTVWIAVKLPAASSISIAKDASVPRDVFGVPKMQNVTTIMLATTLLNQNDRAKPSLVCCRLNLVLLVPAKIMFSGTRHMLCIIIIIVG